MLKNEYLPFSSEILEIIRHTDIEYTFRMSYRGSVRPGQFFEVSIPKYGEAPISVSGISEDSIDFTIRRVGRVTDEIFESYIGDKLFLRGPYGNGFEVEKYENKELVIVAGGTGLSPVKGVVDYFTENPDKIKHLNLIAGFKSPADILFFEDIGKWKKSANVILTVDCAEDDTTCQVGLVTEHIPDLEIDHVKEAVAIVVGPSIMMHFASESLLDIGFEEENIWISQERKMCCGIGKCGHCKVNDTYICLEGPVFNYVDGKDLID